MAWVSWNSSLSCLGPQATDRMQPNIVVSDVPVHSFARIAIVDFLFMRTHYVNLLPTNDAS